VPSSDVSELYTNCQRSSKLARGIIVGVVNTAVDYGFLAVHVALDQSLVAANALSWIVAVSGSYMLNSTITFAAESGRKLRWSAYFTFVASGIVGWLANTATLLVAADVLLLSVWLAKLLAVAASFTVNFSLSHKRRAFAAKHGWTTTPATRIWENNPGHKTSGWRP
jgi:putative flippase GtrA